MAITFREGDIFQSSAQTLVNTVNCEGYMGKGLALQVKKAYPAVDRAYREACSRHELRPGAPQLVKTNSRWVINFPTKNRWRAKSKIKYIEDGLDNLVEHYRDWGLESIAFPQLGSGLGGLDWDEVKPIMLRYLAALDIPVEIWVSGAFEREQSDAVSSPPRRRGRRNSRTLQKRLL